MAARFDYHMAAALLVKLPKLGTRSTPDTFIAKFTRISNIEDRILIFEVTPNF